jgi:RimJ/RimL family protein N-acetyltransferase
VAIRRQEPADLAAHLEAVDVEQMRWLWEPGDPQRYLAMSPQEQRAHQRRHLEHSHDAFGSGPKWAFSVDTAADRYVAYVDCDLANDHVPLGEANISYACAPQHRGKGYTSRAVRLVCEFLRRETSAREAHILVDPDNVASLRVARAIAAVETETFVNERGLTMIRHVLVLNRAAP